MSRRGTAAPNGIARWAPPFLVAALTLLAFLPVLTNGFVTWDDDRNFLQNPYYRGLAPSNLHWMWTTFHLGHYVPLSWMTLGLDYELWGMNPAGYHFTNLILHAANAVVLYFVFKRLLRLAGVIGDDHEDFVAVAAPAIGALLFALHPLRVESVAWVTERRDVLSGLLYSASVLLYLRAADRDARRDYWASVAVFLCALLSKATVVTLPAVLLLLNIYPLKAIGGEAGWLGVSARRVYARLTPFAAGSVAAVVLSIVALRPPDQLGLGAKIAVSAYSLAFYLWRTIVPANLSPLYGMPLHVHPFEPRFVVASIVVVALLGGLFAFRRRWPGAAMCLLAFVVISLPMLGVVQNGPQLAADRYTYHSGPALALLAAAAFVFAARRARAATVGIAALAILACAALTWDQISVWHDSEQLWTRVLALEPESAIGHTAMASLLLNRNDAEGAEGHARRALSSDPTYAEGYNNLGLALTREGRFEEAAPQFEHAIVLAPANAEAHNNLGAALAHGGDLNGAIAQYQRALELRPGYDHAQTNWGNALVRLGRWNDALGHYRAALQASPGLAEAHVNWGVALAQGGRLTEAATHFQQALAIEPDNADARAYLERVTAMREQAPLR